jgi:hypothetical protein
MRIISTVVAIVLAAGAALLIQGCAEFKPLAKEAAGISTPGEIPTGPGLFTGAEGKWTLEAEI